MCITGLLDSTDEIFAPYSGEWLCARTLTGYRSVCRHILVWLHRSRIPIAAVDTGVLSRFLEHECDCLMLRTGASTRRSSRYAFERPMPATYRGAPSATLAFPSAAFSRRLGTSVVGPPAVFCPARSHQIGFSNITDIDTNISLIKPNNYSSFIEPV